MSSENAARYDDYFGNQRYVPDPYFVSSLPAQLEPPGAFANVSFFLLLVLRDASFFRMGYPEINFRSVNKTGYWIRSTLNSLSQTVRNF